jgi:hypothetical protein
MRTFVIVLAFAGLLIAAIPAGADWVYTDNWKMHYPQYPDSNGLDIMFRTPIVINNVNVRIYSDIPADPPEVPFSRPGGLLWVRNFGPAEIHVREYSQGNQGWYNPNNGFYEPVDHQEFYICNIDSIPDPFLQIRNRIYWLALSVDCVNPLGWKTSLDHFNDDGVWGDFPNPAWQELLYPTGHPNAGESIDLAFVVNGDTLYGSTPIPEIIFDTPGDIQPGATLTFSAQLPASMTLVKQGITEVVDLLWANVDVSIDSYVDPNGYSQVTILGGSGQLDAYNWGSPATRAVMALAGTPVGVSNFNVMGGGSSIHWGSGVVKAEMDIVVSAAGFQDIHARASGSGVADFDNDTVTLTMRSHAWQLAVSEVPLSRWAVIVLTLLLLAAGTAVILRRRLALRKDSMR